MWRPGARRRRRREEAERRAAARLDGMRAVAMRTHGVSLVQIVRVRQWARRGTEADIYDLCANHYQGAWFWERRVELGQVLLVAGNNGYGRIRREDPVLYVPGNGIYDVLSPAESDRAMRYYRDHTPVGAYRS